MAVLETQETIVKARAHNPRLINGPDIIEFTFDYQSASGLDIAIENRREFITIGNKHKKQADGDKYRFTIVWFEPNNNVPERIYALRANDGDRTITIAYVHSVEVIGRDNLDINSGASLTCFMGSFSSLRVGQHDSKQMYRCSLTLQEV